MSGETRVTGQSIPIATEMAVPVSPHDDPECRYVAMPQGMQTYSKPSLHEWQNNGFGAELLGVLEQSLATCVRGGTPGVIGLTACDAGTLRFVDEVLGEGEVSALVDAPPVRLLIRESVVPGIWRVRQLQAEALQREYLETGPVPRALLEWAQAIHGDGATVEPDVFPQGLMNAPALTHEIFAKAAAYASGGEETLNLSLLPMSPADLDFLVSTLGLAGVSILSKGYGDCRISLTRLPNVWWVQHFNSTDQLILNTLEITAMPAVAMAAKEDLEDALARIGEMRADLLGGRS